MQRYVLRWQSSPQSCLSATHLREAFALAASSVVELSCAIAPLKPTSAKAMNFAIITRGQWIGKGSTAWIN